MSDIPKLTEAEAAVLRVYLTAAALHRGERTSAERLERAGLLGKQYRNGQPRALTDLGHQALTAYDAQKRAEIEAPLRERIALIANHPTTTELPDGRVQITLTKEEWERVGEAAR